MAQIAAINLKDITEALRWARDAHKALEIYTNGSKRAIGRPMEDSHRLCLKALRGILFYHPEELVVSVAAGTSFAEVEQALAEKGQILGFEPPDWGALFSIQNQGLTSCAGIIGSNLSGPRRIVAGAARDHILGFHAISGRGVHFQSGGSVVKNVTGYDLSKLMAGSWGTLAVLHQITFKTMPAPETTRTLFLHDNDETDAMQIIEQALGAAYGISGAVYIPPVAAANWPGLETDTGLAAFRLEGTAQTTQATLLDLQSNFNRVSRISTSEGEASEHFWQSVRDLHVFSQPRGNIAAPLWRIIAPPNMAASIASRLAAELEDIVYFIDWGGGLIWVSHDTMSGETDSDNFFQKAAKIRNICLENSAEAILIRASTEARRKINFLPPLEAPLAALTARIKYAFDPNAILNPGRLYFGI